MNTNVSIIDFDSSYRSDFKALNVAWIQKYFKMEDADYKALVHPEENIIQKGGYIALALLENEVVGTCALLKMESDLFDYELAKMSVSPSAQGLGIGQALGKRILEKAKELGAKNIFLESNTVLESAIHLYKKMGFREIDHIETPYERCNIQMCIDIG